MFWSLTGTNESLDRSVLGLVQSSIVLNIRGIRGTVNGSFTRLMLSSNGKFIVSIDSIPPFLPKWSRRVVVEDGVECCRPRESERQESRLANSLLVFTGQCVTPPNAPSKINIMTYYRQHTYLKGDFFEWRVREGPTL